MSAYDYDYDYEMLEEHAFVRREAQVEANLAYEDWRRYPGADGYYVYRASQDRADAAQDALAEWAARIGRTYRQPPSKSVVSRTRPSASHALP
jgi:hypothetical protein